MAASPNVPTVPNTPLMNRYSKDGYTNDVLPSGPCNFTNLSIGGNKCGCRRYTDGLEIQTADARPGFCVCAHHSCYHDHREIVSGVVGDVSMLEGPTLTPRQSMPQTSLQPRLHSENQEVGRPLNQESLPDTLQWSRFIKSGSSQGSLPAIPSQCLLPSDSGSRASSIQGGYSRPFGGLGLQSLSHPPKAHAAGRKDLLPGKDRVQYQNGKAMQLYEDSNGHGFLESVTEVATPSIRSFQDADAEATFIKNSASVQDALLKLEDEKVKRAVTVRSSEDIPTGLKSATTGNDTDDGSLLPRIQSIINHMADHPMKIQNHELRLSHLETASFSHPMLEDVKECYDSLEDRVSEVEEKLIEVVKQQQAADAGSVGSRQLLDTSMDSRMSNTSSALIANAIEGLDYARIQALEAQITELQANAPPSYSRPWEVEVVFLPFGPRLMGIWSSQKSQRIRMGSSSGDEWIQTPNNSIAATQAALTVHDEGLAWDNTVNAHTQQPWLSPRACGLRSKVNERLRSRGLVKLIQIKGPGARDVHAAMLSAFGQLMETVADDAYSHHDHSLEIPQNLDRYMALQASWIPLRKLHKDSCLRFLNVSEMLTPELWTAQFLSSSVAMRATGTRRLFVTQSASYVQHLGPSTAWTWQKLRQLDRIYPDGSFNHTPEGDAHEPCWEFDERLDPPPSAHSSIASHMSLSLRPVIHGEDGAASDHSSSPPVTPNASLTPTSMARVASRPISPLRERHPVRPLHTRVSSMPSLVPLKSPSQPKRRITSFDHESQSSPTRPQTLKRIRTRSPSRPRDTPRWSAGPPSPYNYVEELAEQKRGMTPFAYATPHSNAPYIERQFSVGIEDDEDEDDERGSTTEEFQGGEEYHALSDYDSSASEGSEAQDHQPEDSWEGVQDIGESHENESRIVGSVVEGLRQDNEDSGEGSECPSEYPSTQPEHLVSGDTKAGFRIHVDDEIESS
jgi:hypothetical protein